MRRVTEEKKCYVISYIRHIGHRGLTPSFSTLPAHPIATPALPARRSLTTPCSVSQPPLPLSNSSTLRIAHSPLA